MSTSSCQRPVIEFETGEVAHHVVAALVASDLSADCKMTIHEIPNVACGVDIADKMILGGFQRLNVSGEADDVVYDVAAALIETLLPADCKMAIYEVPVAVAEKSLLIAFRQRD